MPAKFDSPQVRLVFACRPIIAKADQRNAYCHSDPHRQFDLDQLFKTVVST